MNERIKKLRKTLELTQQEFAERIGMKRNSIALIESGRNTSEQTIFAICREFNVNEEWLRTGKGEMFKADTTNELESLAKKYNLSHGEYIFLEKYFKLKPSVRANFFELLEETFSAIHASDISATSPAYINDETTHNLNAMSIDEMVEDYRRQLEAEEKATEKSSALQKNA